MKAQRKLSQFNVCMLMDEIESYGLSDNNRDSAHKDLMYNWLDDHGMLPRWEIIGIFLWLNRPLLYITAILIALFLVVLWN